MFYNIFIVYENDAGLPQNLTITKVPNNAFHLALYIYVPNHPGGGRAFNGVTVTVTIGQTVWQHLHRLAVDDLSTWPVSPIHAHRTPCPLQRLVLLLIGRPPEHHRYHTPPPCALSGAINLTSAVLDVPCEPSALLTVLCTLPRLQTLELHTRDEGTVRRFKRYPTTGCRSPPVTALPVVTPWPMLRSYLCILDSRDIASLSRRAETHGPGFRF